MERSARFLWVGDAATVPYPEVRAAKPRCVQQ